ncbi:MAG: inositol monophosphatase family protein [Deinococcales bacterium]
MNYLETAIRAAKAAGKIQNDYLGKDLGIVSKSVESDLVTVVDAQCEQVIRQMILSDFPSHQILGEESGSVGQSEYVWIVDPLDGTVNYAHGFPFYCVSIALEIAGVLEVGVVYDPVRDELFYAQKNSGAFLNGTPLRVSNQATLSGRAMLATGFPYDSATALQALEVFKRFLALGLPIRRPGAAALDLCYVACGRIDGFFEYKLNAWDCAAGILIIQEAGGQVSNFSGGRYRYEDKKIVASNKIIHQAMLETIGYISLE